MHMKSLYDELVKISAEAEKTQTKIPLSHSLAAGLSGGILGNAVGSLPNAVVMQNLKKDLARTGLETTPAEVERLRTAIHPRGGVLLDAGLDPMGAQHVRIRKPDLLRELAASGQFPKGEVERSIQGGLSTASSRVGAHMMAHELGHGRLRESTLGKIIGHARMPGQLLGGLGGTAMATFADPDSKVSKYAPLVGAAGMLPTIADEAYASLKGYGALKRMGYAPEALGHARRQLGKAFGTYATAAIPLVAAPYVIRKIKKHYKNKREAQSGL